MKLKALTGAQAAAEAMRQINPAVVAAYPITPQTPIVEFFAKFVAEGEVDTEFIPVESEHSALSAIVGASAAGVRTMTATSSQGLALMYEVLNVASGLRLPIVMSVVNRTLSAPINIHCDHSDTMGIRSSGWIQLYCENPQEVYDSTLLAPRMAEGVSLPIMVIQDGFLTSHCVEGISTLPDEAVANFLGDFRPRFSLLDFSNPQTLGPTVLSNYFSKFKASQSLAMDKAKDVYLSLGKRLSRLTSRPFNLFDSFFLEDAEVVLVVASSLAGTVRDVVEKLRNQGGKVGLLKVRLFRPFPYEEIEEALSTTRAVGVVDRMEAMGEGGPLFLDVKASLFDLAKKPFLENYKIGVGGKDTGEEDIKKIFEELLDLIA